MRQSPIPAARIASSSPSRDSRATPSMIPKKSAAGRAMTM